MYGEDNPNWKGGISLHPEYHVNAEKNPEYARKYREKNPEKVRERQREYYAKNAEKLREVNVNIVLRMLKRDVKRNVNVNVNIMLRMLKSYVKRNVNIELRRKQRRSIASI